MMRNIIHIFIVFNRICFCFTAIFLIFTSLFIAYLFLNLFYLEYFSSVFTVYQFAIFVFDSTIFFATILYNLVFSYLQSQSVAHPLSPSLPLSLPLSDNVFSRISRFSHRIHKKNRI